MMRPVRVGVLAAVGFCVAFVLGTAASFARGERACSTAGTIAFERWKNRAVESGNEYIDVWLVDADGSNQRNLTGKDPDPYRHASQPAWSPDGRYVAYVRGYGDDILVVDA